MVIGGREAKTAQEQVVYQRDHAVKLTTAMEDVIATLGCAVVPPVCEKPRDNLPSDTRLHKLLFALPDIQVQVEPLLHAFLQEHWSLRSCTSRLAATWPHGGVAQHTAHATLL